ncbi:hypothetical protein L1987_74441 [Smallanthus sonchifolius]|uniref:Uncharacterized protein n=1 Tax=Smallanthus sonchifolius TaxID=185202 RepID=A0ACB9A2S7_9ASTR|nr:hypothetical protein L1987_74441 [Smallanthus sonchifolius]
MQEGHSKFSDFLQTHIKRMLSSFVENARRTEKQTRIEALIPSEDVTPTKSFDQASRLKNQDQQHEATNKGR